MPKRVHGGSAARCRESGNRAAVLGVAMIVLAAYGGCVGPGVPLMDGETIVERPAIQETLPRRYTDRAITFLRDAVARREGREG